MMRFHRRFTMTLKTWLVGMVAVSMGVPALAQPRPGGPSTRPTTRPAGTQATTQRVVAKVSGKHPNGKDTLLCVVDYGDAPETKEWGLKAAEYAIKRYPKLEEALASEGYTPPREFTLLFKPVNGVAFTTGNVITINNDWIRRRPDDWGMVAHELVHVIQRYRRGEGWITEGIADYLRYYVVEPESKQRAFNAQRQTYKNGYQPAAAFINWLETQKPGTVSKFNAALRERKYNNDFFKELTGGTPDEMWEKFKETLKK
jgi:hypothetical protein